MIAAAIQYKKNGRHVAVTCVLRIKWKEGKSLGGTYVLREITSIMGDQLKSLVHNNTMSILLFPQYNVTQYKLLDFARGFTFVYVDYSLGNSRYIFWNKRSPMSFFVPLTTWMQNFLWVIESYNTSFMMLTLRLDEQV